MLVAGRRLAEVAGWFGYFGLVDIGRRTVVERVDMLIELAAADWVKNIAVHLVVGAWSIVVTEHWCQAPSSASEPAEVAALAGRRAM